MSGVFGIIGGIIVFIIGISFLIAGAIGTAATGKIKHGPKPLRGLSVAALVLGIILCVVAVLIGLLTILL